MLPAVKKHYKESKAYERVGGIFQERLVVKSDVPCRNGCFNIFMGGVVRKVKANVTQE